MNILRKFTWLATVAAALGMTSCDDFLEQMDKDDNTNPKDSSGVSLPNVEYDLDTLMVYFQEIYPHANYGYAGEILSDNFVDNNSINIDNSGKNLVSYDLEPFSNWEEQLFSFEMTNYQENDSERFLYTGFTESAKSAGLFIYAIDNVEESAAEIYGIEKLKSMQGEAYIVRSFANFILENFFAQSYVTGGNTQAMPYVNYPYDDKECTVNEAYQFMQEDLKKGIELMDQYGYPTSKFRFNKEAVYAYATRLNLFMREYSDAIHFADMALGADNAAATKLRDFSKFSGWETLNEARDMWQNENEPSVFMMCDTYSLMMRRIALGSRFAFNSSGYLGTFYTSPTSTFTVPLYLTKSGLYINQKQEYGIFSSKIAESFLYTDTVAGIGFPKLKKIEFTAEETLLCRAEAKLMTGNINGALADMTLWNNSKKNLTGLDPESLKHLTDPDIERIKEYYTIENAWTPLQTWNSCYFDGTIISDMISNMQTLGYNINSEDEIALFRFILHSRRLETVFDGMRFLDLKRFGIEYQHNVGRNGNEPANVYILKYDDPRRALRYDFIEEEPDTVSSKGFAKPNLKLMHEFDYSTIKPLK